MARRATPTRHTSGEESFSQVSKVNQERPSGKEGVICKAHIVRGGAKLQSGVQGQPGEAQRQGGHPLRTMKKDSLKSTLKRKEDKSEWRKEEAIAGNKDRLT